MRPRADGLRARLRLGRAGATAAIFHHVIFFANDVSANDFSGLLRLDLKHGFSKSVYLLTGAVGYKNQSICHGSVH